MPDVFHLFRAVNLVFTPMHDTNSSLDDPTMREQERLKALQAYEILDTAPEQLYDDLVLLVSEICEVPIALVSLVDKDRQWFKARHGLTVPETERDIAFCHHTIKQNAVMIVNDTHTDARFKGNHLVTMDPNIRFYAGAPLISLEGQALGTVCAIDRIPREFTASQIDALSAISRQVMALMEYRKVSEKLAQALAHVKNIESLVPICGYCKSIRNDEGFWGGVEAYLLEHPNFTLTHGICDSCMSDPDILENKSVWK